MAGILDGKTALVTGGASGIGRATAVAMSREGARVAVADMTEDSAAGTVALINSAGGQAIAIGGDVTKEADVAAMVARTVAAFPPLIFLSSTPGVKGRGPVLSGRGNLRLKGPYPRPGHDNRAPVVRMDQVRRWQKNSQKVQRRLSLGNARGLIDCDAALGDACVNRREASRP